MSLKPLRRSPITGWAVMGACVSWCWALSFSLHRDSGSRLGSSVSHHSSVFHLSFILEIEFGAGNRSGAAGCAGFHCGDGFYSVWVSRYNQHRVCWKPPGFSLTENKSQTLAHGLWSHSSSCLLRFHCPCRSPRISPSLAFLQSLVLFALLQCSCGWSSNITSSSVVFSDSSPHPQISLCSFYLVFTVSLFPFFLL
jgi:hypothetical protein